MPGEFAESASGGEHTTPSTVVEMRSSGAPLEVRLDDYPSRNAAFACRTPCELSVPSGRYRLAVGEPGRTPVNTRVIDLYSDRIRVAIDPPPMRLRTFGLIATPGGIAAMGLGIGGIVLGAILASPPCDPLDFSSRCPTANTGTGIAFIAGGAFALLAGVALTSMGVSIRRTSRARVDIRSVAEPSARPGSTR